MNLPVLAGTLSTVLFAAGMLPMLAKAARTRDLASYSLGNLVAALQGTGQPPRSNRAGGTTGRFSRRHPRQ
jgi:hypothetical protein